MALFQKKEAADKNKVTQHSDFSFLQKKEEHKDKGQVLNDEMNTLSRKLRLLEDRYSNLQKKTTLTEQNLISEKKKITNEIRVVNDEVLELRRMIDELDNKLLLIIKELKLCGKKDEIELLKRYINLWEPVNFVTRNEVETLIQDILEENNIIKK